MADQGQSFADFVQKQKKQSQLATAPIKPSQTVPTAAPKQQTPKPQKPEAPPAAPKKQPISFGQFVEGQKAKQHFDEIKPVSQMSTREKTKMLATNPSLDEDIISSAMKVLHDATMDLTTKAFPTPEKMTSDLLEAPNKVLQDKNSTPEQKKAAMERIQRINSKPFQDTLNKTFGGASLIPATAATTYTDWEAMSALFKPLELAAPIFKGILGNTARARMAVTALNSAIGAKFGWDQLWSGVAHWRKGEYAEAVADFGGAAALVVMPTLHHILPDILAKRAIAAEEAKKKAIGDLEILKEKQRDVQNPPFSNDEITRAQAALRTRNPMDAISTFTAKAGPVGEKFALDQREQELQKKIRDENLKSARQRDLARQEQQDQEDLHKMRVQEADAKTQADREKLKADADAREEAHKQRLAEEKAKFQREPVPPATQPSADLAPPPAPEPPNPEKRPYQEPAQVIRGRQPLTAAEREEERYAEMERAAREQLAEEKNRRYRIAHKALDIGLDLEDRQMSDIMNRREKALRAGEGFTVVDRRAPESDLGTTSDLAPTPAEQAVEPPPASQLPNIRDLDQHESVAAWSIMEYEKRLRDAKDPAQRAELEKEIAENKQLLKDVREDKAALGRLNGDKQETRKAGPATAGTTGNEGILKTVTRDIPIRYRLVEGSDLTTSHNADTFAPNRGYPEGVQERDYANDKDAQLAVTQHGQSYDPSFTVSDAPGPEHGPPIVTPDGIVLGGNSRVMSTMRHYDEVGESGENGEAYRVALASKARQFGIDPDKIADMKNPILVREIQNPPETTNELRALGSDLNRTFTRSLSEFERAVSAGKRISQDTLDYVSSQLAEEGSEASIRDLLREKPGPILEKLISDGIVSAQERRQYIDEKTGALNDAGKDFFERALLGAVIDDPRILADTPKSVLRRVEGALASIARIKARGEPWNITDYLKEALREHISAASKGEDISTHLNPPTLAMFPREPIHPIVKALAETLGESSKDVKTAFADYAKDADVDVRNQEGFSFFERPKPWDAFNAAFDAEVRPDEWGTLAPAREEEAPPPLEGRTIQPGTGDRGQVTAINSKNLRRAMESAMPSATPDQISAFMSLAEARARVRGLKLDDWLKDRISRFEERDFGEDSKHRAEVEVAEDGKAIFRAFTGAHEPNIAVMIHELFHIFNLDLSPAEMSEAERHFGPLDGDHIQNMEKFARSGEKYVTTGEAPTPALEGVFAKLKNWLKEIYNAVKSSPLRIRLTPGQKEFFDRMLGGEGKPEPIEPAPEPSVRMSPTETAKTMSDEDLKKAVSQLEKQSQAVKARPEAKKMLEDTAKPFREELARRAPEKKTGDSAVIFTKSRADAALEALKALQPKKVSLFYTEPEEKTIDNLSVVMGHLFENGARDYESNVSKMVDLAGEWTRPYARAAYDKMLADGKKELEARLQKLIPEQQRRQYSDQLGLFENQQAKSRRIELPPGVSREETKPQAAQNTRPNVVREAANARPGAEGREATGRAPSLADQPRSSNEPRGAGRDVRSAGAGDRGGGVQETTARPLRNYPAPRVDVENIPTTAPAVEAGEWKNRLKAAGLAEEIPPPSRSLTQAVEDKLIFKGQPEVVQTALTSLDKYGAVVLATTTGTGKCLASGTPVLMYDGSIKKVECVLVGDLLMGPDSRPRTVLSLASGTDEMYRVTPVKGTPYEVNKDHILSVKMTTRTARKWGFDGKIFNVSIEEYLSKSKSWKHCAKGYRVGVEFDDSKNPFLSLPSYFMGIWLGDGSSHISGITTADPEIVAYIEDVAAYFSQEIRIDTSNGTRCPTYVLTGGKYMNIVTIRLREWGVLRNKHIPLAYKTSNRNSRLELLAGLMDTDGSLSDGGYDFISKWQRLADDVAYVARSLGFAAYVKPCKKTCKNNGKVGTYYRVSISGDISKIPVKIARKKAASRKQKKDVLVTGIKVEPIGVGQYFGFEISGDGLFMLGDFTVTHNTYTGSAIFAEEKPRMGLIITPSTNLNDNWIDTAKGFGVDVKPLPKDGIPKEPGVYIATYKTAAARQGIDKVGWNLLLADESHLARRWYAGTGNGKFLKELANGSDKVIFASATPFHSALEMGYMDKLGLWKRQGFEQWAGKEFNTRKSDTTGNWISPFNPRKLAALRQELINRGMFINLDRDMRGYDVNFAMSTLKPEEAQQLKNINRAFQLAEEYFTQKNVPQMVRAVRGNAASFIKSYLERIRLPEAMELGKKLEGQGWKVAYFTETKKEVEELYDFLKPADQHFHGEISKLLPKLPGVVDSLKGHFGDDIANFTGAHNANRQEELDAFNRGDKKHIVATYGAGGLGVSMHDLSGEAPRAAIYLGPPWSGVMLDQAIGRPWRFGTKSNVQAYFLTSNAGPELRLVLQKVYPRFESLKAAVSGVKKADPIIEKLKDLDAQADYMLGNAQSAHAGDFGEQMQTNAIQTIKDLKIPSAEEAKNKGMQVERRKPLEPISTLQYTEPKDLGTPRRQTAAEAVRALRRPLVPTETEKGVDDPRLLNRLQDQNQASLGVPGGGKPPDPPDEIIGVEQIPPPGHSNVEMDLADPKRTRDFVEWADERYKGLGISNDKILRAAQFERGVRAAMAQLHTVPYVLRQYEMTAELPKMLTTAEMHMMRRVAEYRTDSNQILKPFADDAIKMRRIYEALQRAHDPLKELQGASSEWVDHQPFTREELQAAQDIRDKILEPIIDAVQDVRPDVGKRYRYAPLIRQIDELTSTLYPELNGKIPADLYSNFSEELKASMPNSKDPFSPHTLRRKATPPKALRMDEVLDAYIPGMVRVAEYTPYARDTAIFLSKMPDSALKDYAKKYARIFFGVPSEYQNLEKLHNQFARAVTKLNYSAALDLNPSWFVLHTMKIPFNVWPEIGTKFAMEGMRMMTTPEGHELVSRSGVLLDTMWQVRKPQTEFGKKFSKFLHSGMTVSDHIDRGVAYLGGLAKAKDLGLFGPKEDVGQLTWERINELAARGIDVQKGLDYAYTSAARSNFMYTNSNVQTFIRENPILGQFKSYPVRQAEMAMNIRRLAKEAKSQWETAKKDGLTEEQFRKRQVENGDFEHIDAVARYRRLVMSLVIGAAGALGMTAAGINQRIWPYHMIAILSPPIVFADDTYKLVNKTIQGKATESEWEAWMREAIKTFVPGSSFWVRMYEAEQKDEKKHKPMGLTPAPRTNWKAQHTPSS